ncbi:transcriptional regulator [Burkholderia cenocepacia]|nr:transcriptional regulator [Burkholderia cenocepacia]RQU86866.1 transcriptional regulator [Burkholderia cenocepacia]RQV87777.1 transcriptional regulator [Burkholderia cenocepacia]
MPEKKSWPKSAGALAGTSRKPTPRRAGDSNIHFQRTNAIAKFIGRRGSVSMAQLMDEFEVSRATMKRDIEFLRDRFGCPVRYDAKAKGYVIDSETGRPFELPGVWFNAPEILALLTMLRLVEGVEPGLLDEHLTPLKARLRSMLAEGAVSADGVEQKVKIIHFAARKVSPKHFQIVAGALLDCRRIRLRYWKRETQERTTRDVSPLHLVHYRENWFLDAWCHLRNGIRTFSLEAIEAVEMLDEVAQQVSQDELKEHFEGGYGIFAGAPRFRARLKFSAARAQWVASEQWHPDQSSRTLDDGTYLLEVPYSDDQELLMDLLRHAPEVEVLHPPELRRRFYDALRAAAKKNRPDAKM